MDESIAIIRHIICEDMRKTTRKPPKHNQLYQSEQKSLSVPRANSCQEDRACASRAHMTFPEIELERTVDIALQIVVNTYPEDIGSVHNQKTCGTICGRSVLIATGNSYNA